MDQDITVKAQIGVGGGNSQVLDVRTSKNSRFEDLRSSIAQSQDVNPSRVTCIWNGDVITDMNGILGDFGVTNGSKFIFIVSSRTGVHSEQDQKVITTHTPANDSGDGDLKIVLRCSFESRPFGFAVWANASGKNAIVTKVAGANALQLGIQIGYVVYNCNGEKVYGRPHDEVLELLKTTKCPLKLEFADLAQAYVCSFTAKPLGFTVIQDREENNAKVSKINTRAAQNLGVLIGSYVVGVNNVNVFGRKHKAIIAEINKANFPINIKFRHPPALLMLAPRQRRRKKSGKR